jgi:beta-N-acetylhexosaminidase
MQQLMHSFRGHTAPPEILDGLRRGEISSLGLFGHWNGGTPALIRQLTDTLRHAAHQGGHPAPLIGIDQEGGQLMAVTNGATELPGNMALGATRSPELAEQAGRVLARELLAMGVNLNFAPSVDVNVNPANPVVGIRSFGADPHLVADLGAAMIRGIQAEGLIATAKHFPGHGDVSSDSHHDLSVLAHPRERIDAVEMVPFRAAIRAGVKAIMSAHILFTTLDSNYPATLSRAILHDFLRGELGFDGLVITDAMDMAPVARYGGVESARLALQAGADLVLLAHQPDQLEIARQMRPLARPDALARIQAARQNADGALPTLDQVGCAAHRQIAQTIADRSITLVRDAGQLPLHPGPDDIITVITPEPRDLTPADTSSAAHIGLADAIRQRHARTRAYQLPAGEHNLNAILDAALDAQIVVVGTVAADQDETQAELVRTLHARGQRPIVIALRTPYDLIAFPMIETYLCAYGIRAVTTEAVARVLFGEIEARGALPCPIPDISLDQT